MAKVYDIYKLISLSESLSEESVPLDTFSHMLDDNYWKDNKGEWLGPHNILDVVKKYNGEIDWDEMILNNPDWTVELEKIRNADYTSHSILVVEEDYVIGGMHRLTKAFLDKASEVNIRRFVSLPDEAIYKEGVKLIIYMVK